MIPNLSLAASEDATSVLIVDDSGPYAQALAMGLRMDGYSTRVALSVREALDLVGQQRPHCLLMDFGMDEFDGLNLVHTLRADHRDDIVIIMVTGWDATQPRVAQAAMLVDHHYTKPFHLDDLRRILPPLNAARRAP
ncbi:response regulator transcription factor [Xylophilus sp.]|uniref:response regulator transcription factor n=1 Tax=Xylophilus sp. TaxID=2653893 RepID=UPI0013BD6D27|nr:response regulator [Xylophilus sp.]KAF1048765.1 MAG: Response regulator MprA [Xylophilus sp.]